MFSSTSQMAIIFMWLLCASTINSLLGGQESLNHVRCNEKDQHVLSMFKQGIDDPLKRLSSWSTEEDCCKWAGVQCDNITGSVTKLDLHCSPADFTIDPASRCLGGEINFSIFELEFLSYLDLSMNYFKAIRFPRVHGHANDQRSQNSSLKTSSSPANSSNLLYLNLADNFDLYMDNLRWVSRVPSLKYLNLSEVTINDETPWLQQLTMLPSLVVLGLSGCFLDGTSPSLGYVNFTSLAVLDISDNSLDEVPEWLFSLNSSISYMDLSFNNLRGQISATMIHFHHLKTLRLAFDNLNGSIPEWMGQYKHLEYLDLTGNLFSGPIPAALGNLSSLTSLYLSGNRLNGSLPKVLWKLSTLEVLLIGFNSLSGNLSEESFTKLSNLKVLGISATVLNFDVSTHWQPPFQLEEIRMSKCKLGPEFPSWLYTQRSLSYLAVSSSGLSFNAHEEFWRFIAQIDLVNLSNNSISGDISVSMINNMEINLKANNFTGKLPRLSSKVRIFSIANNSLSGPISSSLCHSMIGKSELEHLDLSNNHLFGEFPGCWMHLKSLRHLNLGSNNLTGKIPDSVGSLAELKTLRIHNNSLSGNIPTSLKSCKQLWFLDLQFNEFTGNIPSWISQLSMAFLLRSNKFNGSIPSNICQFSNLLVLDLANNKLFGPIPKCLSNITAMASTDVDLYLWLLYADWLYAQLDIEHLNLFEKGREFDYSENFMLVRMVDLSNNDLSGLIPPELFSLFALQSLNLSHNHLKGVIPNYIGHMRSLESLDFSSNLFSGEIPQSMSNLSFLNHLNLSDNNFKGMIPLGTQLQSFEAGSYIGNAELCGAPLPRNCTQEENHNSSKSMEDKDNDFTSYFNLGMGVGFAFGFWGVCGTIFFIRRWRHAYFQILDNIYVFIILKMNRFS